jgi:hypothetical protein
MSSGVATWRICIAASIWHSITDWSQVDSLSPISPVFWSAFRMGNSDHKDARWFDAINDTKRKSPYRTSSMARINPYELFRISNNSAQCCVNCVTKPFGS